MNYPVPHGYPTQYVTPLPPRSSTGHVVIAWILAVLTGFYLLPWAIAATRSKRNVGPIVLINIFLGWTLAGWIAALVMACLNDDRPTVVTVYRPVPYGPPTNYQAYPPNLQSYQQPHPAYRSSLPAGYPPVPPQPLFQPASQPTASYPSSYPTASSEAWSRPEDEPTQVIDGLEPPYGGPQRR